jgi:hypothetical protein
VRIKKKFSLPVGKDEKYFLRRENSSYLWERTREIFLFPGSGKEAGKYLYFLPVEKKEEIFMFHICGKEVEKYSCFLPVGNN